MSTLGVIGYAMLILGCAIVGYNLGRYYDYIREKKQRDLVQKQYWQIRMKKIKEQADKKGGKKCL